MFRGYTCEIIARQASKIRVYFAGCCPWLPLKFQIISTDLMPLENANKIVVKNPVVELDGDEMTRIIWKKIREEVCLPLAHLSLPVE